MMTANTPPDGLTRPVSVRILTADEAHVLDRIRPGLFDVPLEPSRTFACLATGLNAVAVAVVDGQVVACGTGTVLMSLARGDRFRMTDLAQHPDFAGQGLAERLAERLMDYAADRGCVSFEVTLPARSGLPEALASALGSPERSNYPTLSWPLT